MAKSPPPPPRSAQNRSASCLLSTVLVTPSAVTTDISTTPSQVSPYVRSKTPKPPPCASPASPTVGQVPADSPRPWAAWRKQTSISWAPAPMVALPVAAS